MTTRNVSGVVAHLLFVVATLATFATLATVTSCGGRSGSIIIELEEEPGSGLLASVDRLRLTLDNPPTIVEATRDGDAALVLDLEIPASPAVGRLTLEAFRDGDLVGVAFSPPLPLGAIDGALSLYVAAPASISAAPIALEPARADIGVAPLSFGAIFLGGNLGDGTASGDVDIYNVYDHEFQPGEDLPSPRGGAAVFASADTVYAFGGTADGSDLAAPIGFDTGVAPAGLYFELSAPAGLARSGVQAASLLGETGIVAGSPALRVDGIARTVSPIDEALPLSGTLTSSGSTSEPVVVGVGAGTGTSGGARVGIANAIELPGPAELNRTGHAAAAEPSGDVIVLGGTAMNGDAILSGIRYRTDTGNFVLLEDILTAGRIDAAMAATDRFIVLAGGRQMNGELHPDALVIDRQTLEVIATPPLRVPRAGADAVALANGQILIVGGRDTDGGVIATIELFTPSL